jgi:hypothetical protein
VVNENVPPYAMVGSVPAKALKCCFAPDIIKRLLADELSNSSDEALGKLLIEDMERFLEKTEEIKNGIVSQDNNCAF